MNKFKNDNGYMEQDLRGQRFGLLVVIDTVAVSDRREVSKPEALCQCCCGNITPVRTDGLKDGRQISCGCKQRNPNIKQHAAAAQQANKSHGLRGHYLYNTWRQMNRRCHDERAHNYKHYGAQGVDVFVSWRKEAGPRYFIWFCDNHLGPRPEGYTLDRINPAGNYEPGNVRWASPETQANNKRPVPA